MTSSVGSLENNDRTRFASLRRITERSWSRLIKADSAISVASNLTSMSSCESKAACKVLRSDKNMKSTDAFYEVGWFALRGANFAQEGITSGIDILGGEHYGAQSGGLENLRLPTCCCGVVPRRRSSTETTHCDTATKTQWD